MFVARSLLLAVMTGTAAQASAFAAVAEDISVEAFQFPAPFLEATAADHGAGGLDRVLEASAVEPIGDGTLLLVAHDKKVPLRVIEASSGRAVGPPLTSPRFPAETPKSSKWEAMARDSDGSFYVVGSHSGKTDDERSQHERLIRFRLRPESSASKGSGLAIDDDSVVSWRLAKSLVRALQAEGLDARAIGQRKIEGLTIRENPAGPDGKARRDLVIGLRQPDDLVRVFSTDITAAPAPDAELPITRLFAFEPGEREGVRCQLTSLEYLPAWNGFLVITATEDDENAFHGNTLWFVPDERIARGNGSPIQAEKVWTFEVGMKAEGVCILPPAHGQDAPEAGAVRLLITYDNDAHVTHSPSRYQVVNLVRRGGGH